MSYKDYYKKYISSINDILSDVDTDLIDSTVDLLKKKIDSNNTIYLAGNGGSSSIASHVSVDLVKIAKAKSQTFNESNLITCFANDYGYENWIKEAIKSNCVDDDLVILISSSGQSQNIINAAKFCNEKKIDLITFSGFDINNPLLKMGKINFHVNSTNYNFVEMAHHIILVSIVDIFDKKNI